jgi:hypothetical protein
MTVADVLHRLAAIDREQPVIDRRRIEAAFDRHFDALGLPMPPVQHVADAQTGYLGTRHARDSELWTAAASTVRPDPWQAQRLHARAMDIAWPAAERVARNIAEQAAWRAARLPHADSTAWLAPRTVAAGAVKFVIALEAARNPPPEIGRVLPTPSLLEVWEPFITLYEAGAWLFWPLEDRLVVVGRPAIRSDRGQLQCADGPAVAWPNGIQYFVWQNVVVPARVIEHPESVKAADIARERDPDVRQPITERLAYNALMKDPERFLIHWDDFGALYRGGRGGRRDAAAGRHASPSSPPGAAGGRTAREAVAWTFDMPAHAYAPLKQS